MREPVGRSPDCAFTSDCTPDPATVISTVKSRLQQIGPRRISKTVFSTPPCMSGLTVELSDHWPPVRDSVELSESTELAHSGDSTGYGRNSSAEGIPAVAISGASFHSNGCKIPVLASSAHMSARLGTILIRKSRGSHWSTQI